MLAACVAGLITTPGAALAAADYEFRTSTGSRQPLWQDSTKCDHETSGPNCSRLMVCSGAVYSTPNRIKTLQAMIKKGPVKIYEAGTFDVVCTAS